MTCMCERCFECGCGHFIALIVTAHGRRVQKDVWALDDSRKGLPFLRLQTLANKDKIADFPFRLKWGVNMQRGACEST